jgi:hypothetical protein
MIGRYKRPDKKNALSLINASKRDIEFTLTLKPDEKSGAIIIKNIYESFRMLGDALLVLKGIESQDHLAPINELLKLQINTKKPLGAIGNLRILRHNINYYGYSPNIAEVLDVISLAKELFLPLFKEIDKKITQEF